MANIKYSNTIINAVPDDGIRFKDLVIKTGIRPSTLRYNVMDLVVSGDLRIVRSVNVNRICLTVYPAKKQGHCEQSENAGIVSQSVAAN